MLRRAPRLSSRSRLQSEGAVEGGHHLLATWIPPFPAEIAGARRARLPRLLVLPISEELLPTRNVCSAGAPTAALRGWPLLTPRGGDQPPPLMCSSSPRPAPAPHPGAPHAPLPPAPPPVSPGPVPSNYAAHESFFNVWFNTYRFFKQ